MCRPYTQPTNPLYGYCKARTVTLYSKWVVLAIRWCDGEEGDDGQGGGGVDADNDGNDGSSDSSNDSCSDEDDADEDEGAECSKQKHDHTTAEGTGQQTNDASATTTPAAASTPQATTGAHAVAQTSVACKSPTAMSSKSVRAAVPAAIATSSAKDVPFVASTPTTESAQGTQPAAGHTSPAAGPQLTATATATATAASTATAAHSTTLYDASNKRHKPEHPTTTLKTTADATPSPSTHVHVTAISTDEASMTGATVGATKCRVPTHIAPPSKSIARTHGIQGPALAGCLPWSGVLNWHQPFEMNDLHAVGRWGEALVHQLLRVQHADSVVKWMNQDEETKAAYVHPYRYIIIYIFV